LPKLQAINSFSGGGVWYSVPIQANIFFIETALPLYMQMKNGGQLIYRQSFKKNNP